MQLHELTGHTTTHSTGSCGIWQSDHLVLPPHLQQAVDLPPLLGGEALHQLAHLGRQVRLELRIADLQRHQVGIASLCHRHTAFTICAHTYIHPQNFNLDWA